MYSHSLLNYHQALLLVKQFTLCVMRLYTSINEYLVAGGIPLSQMTFVLQVSFISQP